MPEVRIEHRLVLTKLCSEEYANVCDVTISGGKFVSIKLKEGVGEVVKGSEKIVEAPTKPAPVTPAPGKVTQQPTQGKNPAPVQKPVQGKTPAPVEKPVQGKTPAPVVQKPEQGVVKTPAPKQAEKPKQEQRSSQQGPKAA